ncbi:MAG: Ig-like domain repeat protein [Thaumarchaeota archaeon]|nr:Ig-like domain repeat protein [Nitrososphaerota archaeon]
MSRPQVEHKKTFENRYNESTFYNFKSYLIVFVAVFGIIMVSSFNNSYADSLITLSPTDSNPTNISHTSNDVYVTNLISNTVSVINATTENVVTTIAVGIEPYGIAYDDYNGKIYVANFGSDNISVIDPSSNTVIQTISGVTNPTGLMYDSTNQDLYVTSMTSNQVFVIDLSSNNVIATITVGTQPDGITYDDYNGKIYVANFGSDNISVIDPSSNTEIQKISSLLVGSHPSGLMYDSINKNIYVANNGVNTVSVIDSSSNNVINTISVGTGPIDVTYSTSNNIYVTNFYSNTVSVINGTSNTVTTTIAVDQNPYGVVYDDYNGKIYVANSGANTISVIDSSLTTTPPQPTPTVNKTDPITTIASSANPSVVGKSVTFTATVTSPDGTPTGTVNFMDGTTDLGSCTLSGNSCTLSSSSFSIGTHPITASYIGDANFNPSTSTPLTQTVTKADPITTVVSSVNPSVIGQSVTFIATVTSPDGTPTGTVTFFDGSTILGTGILSGGVAMFSTSSLSSGSHSITASYSDNSNYEPSTSSVLTQMVQYKFGVFMPPVTDGGQYNLGRTIPIKFQIFNANNNLLTTATGTVSVDGIPAISNDNILQGNNIKLNGVMYTFNMSTKGLAAGAHTITVALDDGSVHSIVINLK